MKWIIEDETRAVMLLESGLCYDEIGKILNRSSKSVKEKLGKLGYKREDYIQNNEIKIFCLECGFAFETKDHERKFCGQSCAASYNNKKFVKRKSNKERQYKCLNCHSLTPTFMALNKGRGRKYRTWEISSNLV